MVLNKRRFEAIVLEYVFIMASISNYIEHLPIWRIIQATLFILLIFCYKSYARKLFSNLHLTVPLMIFGLVYIGSIVISEDNTFLLNNSVKIFAPIISCLIFAGIARDDREVFNRFMISHFWIFNAWWIINIILILIQASGTPIFIKQSWISGNKLYADLCCGLFGYNRTHEVNFYTCFIVVYNLCMSKNYYKIKKSILVVYIIASIVVSGYLSLLNDNIALFLTIPVFILIYVYVNELYVRRTIIAKIGKALRIILCILIGLLVCSRIQPLVDIYNDVIYHRIERVLFANNVIGGVSGSNERLAQIFFSLNEPSSWLFGAGIGNDTINEHTANRFVHFGMNSFSSHIWLLGLWSILSEIYLIAQCIITCMPVTNNKRKRILTCLCILTLSSLSIYSNIMISQASIVWIFLCFASMKIEAVAKKQNRLGRIESERRSNCHSF